MFSRRRGWCKLTGGTSYTRYPGRRAQRGGSSSGILGASEVVGKPLSDPGNQRGWKQQHILDSRVVISGLGERTEQKHSLHLCPSVSQTETQCTVPGLQSRQAYWKPSRFQQQVQLNLSEDPKGIETEWRLRPEQIKIYTALTERVCAFLLI